MQKQNIYTFKRKNISIKCHHFQIFVQKKITQICYNDTYQTPFNKELFVYLQRKLSRWWNLCFNTRESYNTEKNTYSKFKTVLAVCIYNCPIKGFCVIRMYHSHYNHLHTFFPLTYPSFLIGSYLVIISS